MAPQNPRSSRAKAQRKIGAEQFVAAASEAESSDTEWIESDEGEDKIDLDDSHNQMASLYSFFLPRELQPKTVVYHDEKKV